jgi:hypothetical protein
MTAARSREAKAMEEMRTAFSGVDAHEGQGGA